VSGCRPQYRVRAPNDRSQPKIAPSPEAYYKIEAIEPRTIVIIARCFDRVSFRPT
jgi:hypothetical protein